MKGVSAVIAVILLLMITVALAATSYVWFSSIFSTVTTGGTAATEKSVAGIQTSFLIESSKYAGSNTITVAVRNTGSVAITSGTASAYINDQFVNITGTGGTWAVGGVGILNVTNSTYGAMVCNSAVVKISFGVAQQTRTITC